MLIFVWYAHHGIFKANFNHKFIKPVAGHRHKSNEARNFKQCPDRGQSDKMHFVKYITSIRGSLKVSSYRIT